MIGFVAPPPGTRMCAYLVVHGSNGPLDVPRACKRGAKEGSPFCGVHGRVAAKLPAVTIREGGYCAWCGQPARSYVCDRVTIALCGAHGKALARAVREGR